MGRDDLELAITSVASVASVTSVAAAAATAGVSDITAVVVAGIFVHVAAAVPSVSAPGVPSISSIPTAVSGSTGLESASELAVLIPDGGSRADADDLSSGGEASTASRCAVGCAQTLAADELCAGAVADVLVSGGIWEVLAGVEAGSGGCLDCGKDN